MKATPAHIPGFLLAAVILGSCSPVQPAHQPETESAGQASSEPAVATAPLEPEIVVSTDAATTVIAPTLAVSPTNTQAPAAVITPVVVKECPFTPDLHATDPTTVALASGQVQLVEFFAFW